MKESLSQAEKWFVHPDRWNDVLAASIYPLEQVGPSDPTNSYNPLWYGHIPMILAIEVTVSLFGISYHLVGPFKEGFVLDFF